MIAEFARSCGFCRLFSVDLYETKLAPRGSWHRRCDDDNHPNQDVPRKRFRAIASAWIATGFVEALLDCHGVVNCLAAAISGEAEGAEQERHMVVL